MSYSEPFSSLLILKWVQNIPHPTFDFVAWKNKTLMIHVTMAILSCDDIAFLPKEMGLKQIASRS